MLTAYNRFKFEFIIPFYLEYLSSLPGFEPGPSPVASLWANHWAMMNWYTWYNFKFDFTDETSKVQQRKQHNRRHKHGKKESNKNINNKPMADTAGYHASTAPEDFFKKTYESHFLEVGKDSSLMPYL